MSHGVHNAQTAVGESHSGQILAQSHAFPALWLVLHRIPQAAGDYFNGF